MNQLSYPKLYHVEEYLGKRNTRTVTGNVAVPFLIARAILRREQTRKDLPRGTYFKPRAV